MQIGCHISSAKGFLAMGKQAKELGANVFQFFTRNPRGSKAKEMDYEDAAALMQFLKANEFGPILAHAPYTLNPCSAKKETREFAYLTMKDDLKRMEALPGNMYNFHPGSHVGQGSEQAIDLIADLLNEVISKQQHTTILLETMAGKGTEVGRTFEELQKIVEKVELSSHVGICMDTCHIFDAGYDITNQFEQVMEEFEQVIGIHKLKAIHLNDSKNPLGSKKDRHEKIGEGKIGMDTFQKLINYDKFKDIPMYLETPNDLEGYKYEISMIKQMKG